MKTFKFLCMPAIASLLGANISFAESPLHPSVMSKADIAADITQQKNVVVEKSKHGGNTFDITSMLSSDKKFIVGKFQAGPSRSEINEPYGVDEYMHFLEGGVTLTSSDGTVTEINAGDSVTIAKEWTGIWETKGYTKIYIIYSPDAPIE